MKVFLMYRTNDETGVSGTGLVVEGIIFANGKVAARWFGELSSINIYDSWSDFESIHITSHPKNKTNVNFMSINNDFLDVEAIDMRKY